MGSMTSDLIWQAPQPLSEAPGRGVQKKGGKKRLAVAVVARGSNIT